MPSTPYHATATRATRSSMPAAASAASAWLRATALGAVLGAAAAGTAWAQSYPGYTVSPLPITGFTAFNDRGQVLGRAIFPCPAGQFCTQSDQPALVDTTTGERVPVGPGFGALNNLGQLAGARTTVDATGQLVRSVVVRQVDGTVTTVAPPVLSLTAVGSLQARGFNHFGQIALQLTDGLDIFAPNCGTYPGWIGSSAGTWMALGTAGGSVSLSGLSANAQAVGAVAMANCGEAAYHAVAALASGALIDLHGSTTGAFSKAFAINDLGYAVGEFDTGLRTQPDANYPQGMPITHASVWNTASLAAFDLGPSGALSRLNAVNNRGEVVGRAAGPVAAGQPNAGLTAYAVLGNLATSYPLVNLNSLLVNNIEGWVLSEALAINSAGQIVASGRNAASSGYVLLSPSQPPADPYAVAPSAPASLSAIVAVPQAVQLDWVNTARNATQLRVERCKGGNCKDFAPIALLPGDTSRFVDGGAARRTTYRYRVRAANASGASAPSNVAQVTTLR